MIQPRTQNETYWGPDFALTNTDIEQIYNHFLEVERPQTTDEIVRMIMAYRVAEEASTVKKKLSGRTIYQPQNSYELGDQLVFPALQFAHGDVTAVRDGYNPHDGQFKVIAVEIEKESREFAADLQPEHILNADEGNALAELVQVDVDELVALYGAQVKTAVAKELTERAEFVKVGHVWFVKQLMAEVNAGHLHLAEAVLEINSGGPLPTEEILPHLDMDPTLDTSVQHFSLNYYLMADSRFDEVAPKGEVAWFLQRLEPEEVQKAPDRLHYQPIPHDRALLSPQLLLLERELDDEWSDLEEPASPQPVVFTLLFPHRYAGVIPLGSRIRPLFPPTNSPRQRVRFIDDQTEEEVIGWVVHEHRYIYGLGDWYEKNGIPIGGFVHIQPGPEPGVLSLGYDRRRPQREWVRLATAVDNRIHFELQRRSVGCGFDDLMVVGTDVVAAIDVLWRRAENQQRTVSSLLAEIFPKLSELTPQSAVHAKTLYSAINMLRRMPPGPLFAELVRHQAFLPVGDHYWQFDKNRWQEGA
ncbi:MAG: hypothetical protein H6656_08770 [Ardenticatenaceae bacterium]|nr:hypothetical protein [Ardenticatenaceae bacterium]